MKNKTGVYVLVLALALFGLFVFPPFVTESAEATPFFFEEEETITEEEGEVGETTTSSFITETEPIHNIIKFHRWFC